MIIFNAPEYLNNTELRIAIYPQNSRIRLMYPLRVGVALFYSGTIWL